MIIAKTNKNRRNILRRVLGLKSMGIDGLHLHQIQIIHPIKNMLGFSTFFKKFDA